MNTWQSTNVTVFLSEQSVYFSVILTVVVLGVIIAATGIGKSSVFTSLFTIHYSQIMWTETFTYFVQWANTLLFSKDRWIIFVWFFRGLLSERLPCPALHPSLPYSIWCFCFACSDSQPGLIVWCSCKRHLWIAAALYADHLCQCHPLPICCLLVHHRWVNLSNRRYRRRIFYRKEKYAKEG